MNRLPSVTRRILAVIAIVLIVAGCSGPDRASDQAVASPPAAGAVVATPPPTPPPTSTATPPTATATTAPSPTATLPPPTPTATATVPPTATPITEPTPTATATPLPTATPVIELTPASQAVDLPDVDAHYRIDITALDVEQGFVRASEVITIHEFHGAVPERLYLQVVPAAYGFFTLDRAFVQGEVVAPEVLNDGFTLAFDLPSTPPLPYEIALDFHLNVGTETTGWGVTARDAGILRLGNWFPIISTDHGYSQTLDPSYTATAAFDVTLAVDPDVEFAHTGEITRQEALDDGRVRYTMHAEEVRDFAMALSRSYTVDSGVSSTGVQIELYTVAVAPETRQAIIDWTADAIDQISALVGPYPYPTFQIADAGPTMPGGVEFPGLIYINPAYSSLDRLIYHEVAHQWLYGIIGTRTLEDGWIDEGGAEFFERGLPTGFSEIPTPPDGGYMYPLDATYRELSVDSGRQWYYSIYEQGALFYYDVMHAMGPDAFWAAMRDLYDTHRFGIATAWDVLATFQEHSTPDLRPLFDDYFRYDWIDELPPSGDAA